MYKGGRWASVVESEGTFKLVSALRLTDISACPVTKWVFTDLETSRCEHIPVRCCLEEDVATEALRVGVSYSDTGNR